MKYTYLKSLFIITFIFTTTIASAQSGVIYFFSFNVDPLLTDYIKVDDKSRTWLSGYSEGEAMPDELIDSIKIKTEEVFTSKLKMPVKLCYRKNKKGEDISSIGVSGYLEGLPSNTFNDAKSNCAQNSRYIYLDVKIYSSGGTSITTVSTKTKLKPKLQIIAKVFDENKNELLKKNIVIKDFAKLRSKTDYYENVELTTSEVLTPFDIYAMYLMGLDELMKE